MSAIDAAIIKTLTEHMEAGSGSGLELVKQPGEIIWTDDKQLVIRNCPLQSGDILRIAEWGEQTYTDYMIVIFQNRGMHIRAVKMNFPYAIIDFDRVINGGTEYHTAFEDDNTECYKYNTSENTEVGMYRFNNPPLTSFLQMLCGIITILHAEDSLVP